MSDAEDAYRRQFADLASRLQGIPTRAAPFQEIASRFPERLHAAISGVIRSEQHLFQSVPRTPPEDFSETVRQVLALQQREYFTKNPERTLETLQTAVTSLFELVEHALPATNDAPSLFTVPIAELVQHPRAFVQSVHLLLRQYRRASEPQFFVRLLDQIHANLTNAGVDPPHDIYDVRPVNDKAIPDRDLLKLYFSRTPLMPLFEGRVSLHLSQALRFSHMHVIGGTGAGKTTLLENLIYHDLKSPDRPALVIVDSQGDLIRKVSHLAVFDEELADKLILISPKDIENPPALNVFDVNRDRLSSYGPAAREQIVASAIQTFDYLFAGLLGADLTAKQDVFFKFIARLMLALPDTLGRNATILDMLRLMEDPAPYRKAIESLPPIQRNFFERDFQSKTFAQTKEQIRYRLHAIIENPTLARLFTSPTTKVDLFAALNERSIILVDTAKDFLKGSSGHFGQIFISLVLQAVLERAVLNERDRVPAFLIVDEAAEYFDSNIDDLLTEARKQKLGCVFAHQYLDQCTPSLRASFAANTATKFACGVSTSDARNLAADMRTSPEFILSQPMLSFAAYVRGVTPHAVSVRVPVAVLEKEPQLTADQYEELLARNRQRVSYQPDASPVSPRPDEDVSESW